MKFLVFQHIACEHPGIFRDLMHADSVKWEAVQLDEGEQIPSFDGYDALLVMGGPMDVWQQQEHPWLTAEIDAIARWVRSGRPYLGFCLGHQLLAMALGGQVGPSVIPEIGVLAVELTDLGSNHWFFDNCQERIMSLQWHSAEITELPEGGKILARSEACKVNAMAWGDVAVSVQFHVELTENTVSEWGEVPIYASALETAMGESALGNMKALADQHMAEFNGVSAILYRNFCDHVKSRLQVPAGVK